MFALMFALLWEPEAWHELINKHIAKIRNRRIVVSFIVFFYIVWLKSKNIFKFEIILRNFLYVVKK